MAVSLLSDELAVAPNGVEFLRVPGWSCAGDWLWHGFSTRRGGVSSAYSPVGDSGELNLGYTAADTAENVHANRLRFAEAVTGVRETPLVTVRQIHSNFSVIAAGPVLPGNSPCEADGMMTDRPGLLIGVMTADCIPVLVADPVRRAVGAFHAGWRGTVERIVELGVARMVEVYGSEPGDLLAAIGPGIGACCYTVGEEVLQRFGTQFSYAGELFSGSLATNELRVDLVEANRRQLLAAGLVAGSVSVVGGCTACQPGRFYSHRAARGHAGRMMAVVGIRV
jgi:YfiH family protein